MSTDGAVLKKARLVKEEAQHKKKDERRRWEEMDMDCLANAFNKAGMEPLFLAIPFVCKSWHKASLSSICWTCLSFPEHKPYPLLVNTVEEIDMYPQSFGAFYDKFVDQYGIDQSRFSITAFVKLVVDRSQGKATKLKLPMLITEAALRCVANACPLLTHLEFEDDLVIFKHSQILPEVIGKWKALECLSLGGILENTVISSTMYFSNYFKDLLTKESPSCYNVLERIIVQIGTHCKNFRQLRLAIVHLHPAEALAIVKYLPHIHNIVVYRCTVEKDSLLTIVRGCKQLWVFHALKCSGFEEGDEDICKLDSQTGAVVVCQECVHHDELQNAFGAGYPTLFRKYIFNKVNMLGQ